MGFSKFCSERPLWCVTAGSSGTHSVCVCSKHQNTILLLDALNWNISYKDLINILVCDSCDRMCMVHRCKNCPGTAALKKILEEKFKDLDSDIAVEFCQWQTTDRSTLYTQTASLEVYKDLLISSINSLTAHSFIA